MRRVLGMCRTAAWLSIFFLGSGQSFGQAPASVRGTVTDPSGAAVPNATVRLVNSANNTERTTTTDQRGAYSFTDVASGRYRLLVDAPGFDRYERADLAVPDQTPAAVDIQLKLIQVQQNVTVNGQYADQCLAPAAHILPGVGPGLRAIRRGGPAGNFYVLTAPGAVSIYSPDGKRIGQVPAQPSPQSSIVSGTDLQVDAAGRVYVADVAANAVKVYSADGTLARAIRVPGPVSVEPLASGEVAVASVQSTYLVDVYDVAQGKLYRSMGDATRPSTAQCDPVTLVCTAHKETDPPARHDWFYGDSSGNVYVSIVDASAPTIRKYDATGYLVYESTLPSKETLAAAKNANWKLNSDVHVAGVGNIGPADGGPQSSASGAPGGSAPAPPGGGRGGGRGEGGGGQGGIAQFGVRLSQGRELPASKPVIDALGVDPANQEVWAAVGEDLVRFDQDGQLAGYYCLSSPDRAPLKATTILVEPDRILIGSDPFGISQYARPDKPLPTSADSH